MSKNPTITWWFKSRRKKIARTVGDIPIAVERELMKRFKGALGMSVSAVGRWDFEVVAKVGEQFHVSLEQQTCTCLEFQKIRIPFTHAMVVAHDRGLEFRTLVGEMHRLGMWAPTVQEPILLVRDPSEVDVRKNIRVLCLMPPKINITLGDLQSCGYIQLGNMRSVILYISIFFVYNSNVTILFCPL